MKYFLLLTGISILALTSMTCHAPTEPSSNSADTTSNSFTFKTYTFGGNAGSCLLNDVAIVSDTNIWAVGAIYVDSADGNADLSPYNAVHWDGQAWTLLRVPYLYQGQPFYHPIQAVFALSPNDIWFGGNGMEHWDGQDFLDVEDINPVWPSSRMRSIWASSDRNIYVVGDEGTAAHFGGSWQALNTGTTTDINDVWGAGNSPVYCAVSNSFDPNEEKRILKITNGTKVDTVSWVGREVSSVWTPDGTHLYACGDGVFQNDGTGWKEMVTGASIYTSCIRGNGTDDIVVVGGFGFIAHWNGAHWKIYTSAMDAIYTRVAAKGNLIVAVGNSGTSEQTVITMGRR